MLILPKDSLQTDYYHNRSVKNVQAQVYKILKIYKKLDIENPIIRINTAFKGCSSLEKISVLPRIYHN